MTDHLQLILVLIVSYVYKSRFIKADLPPAYDVLVDLAILVLSLLLRTPVISFDLESVLFSLQLDIMIR